MNLTLDAPATGADSPGQKFKWSASRLKRLLQCPRQFRYVYLDELPTVATAPQVFGQTMHHIVCQAHEHQMRSGVLPPINDLLCDFDEAWSQSLEEKQPLFRANHPNSERFTTLGHEMLRTFYNRHATLPAPLAVELPFQIEVSSVHVSSNEVSSGANDEGFVLCGIIDRIDEIIRPDGSPALVVIDYKSGQKKPSASELESDLQLTVYALAAAQFVGLPVERLEIHFLRDDLELPAQRTPASIEWVMSQVLPYAERALKRGHFPPHPGFWCNWCEFRARCDAEGFHDSPITPPLKGEPDGLRR